MHQFIQSFLTGLGISVGDRVMYRDNDDLRRKYNEMLEIAQDAVAGNKKLLAMIRQMANEEIGFIRFIRRYNLEREFDGILGYGALAKLDREAQSIVDS